MTDEKKKPEQDEVTDEQLEGVAGGLFLQESGTSGGGDTSTGDDSDETSDTKTSTSSGKKLNIDPHKNLN